MPVISGLTDPTLIKLFHRGKSDRWIAHEYGISVQAVSARRSRLGLRRKTISRQVNEYLAKRWTVKAGQNADIAGEHEYSHHNRHSAQRLREWLRLQLGDTTLSDRQVALAEAWVEERRVRDDVLCYDPDLEEGWYYRPRRPEDGQLLIDWPKDMPFPDDRFRKALELPQRSVKDAVNKSA